MEKYTKAQMEVIEFEREDVITSSSSICPPIGCHCDGGINGYDTIGCHNNPACTGDYCRNPE